jgi:hypothetical protein
MEVRIARITNLLAKTASISEVSNADTDEEQFTQFMPDKQSGQNDKKDNRHEKKQVDRNTAMLQMSVKGTKHSNLLNKTQKTQDKSSYTIVHNELTQMLKGLSNQVVNGQFQTTDRMNFDTELKLLSSLLKNADNEVKCEILSERINNLSRIVNKATVNVDEDEIIYRLLDPDYENII